MLHFLAPRQMPCCITRRSARRSLPRFARRVSRAPSHRSMLESSLASNAGEELGQVKFDPDRVRRAALPGIRQSVSPEMAALYALSIGIGQDPLDCAALRFVVAGDPMSVVP